MFVTVICVELLTVTVPTIRASNSSKLTVVTPEMKPVPVMLVEPCNVALVTEFGVALAIVGGGLPTVNDCIALDPPAGAAFVIWKLLVPIGAVDSISISAVISVELFTVVESTLNPAGATTELTPLMKRVPVNCTVTVSSRLPAAGLTAERVGAGLLTVKVCVVLVPPPGPAFVISKLLAPVAAVDSTSMS